MSNVQQVIIRPMTQDDVPIVFTIELVAQIHDPWTVGIFRDCIAVGYECCVIEVADRIVGYYIMSTAAEETHILNIVVKPNMQGRGYGKQLLQALMASARAQHSQRIFLEVRVSNKIAQAMYFQEGFKRIGMRRDYYPCGAGREDAITMELVLSDEQ
ncbi:MAG: ribosomal protein S18-alanine N-acetyltransferase [Gammaproteobacteria bacterium]